MEYTNAQILAAVLNKWLQPAVRQLAGQRLSSMPFFSSIENKVRSTGWVSPSWRLSDELAPVMQKITGTMLEPLIAGYLAKVPDESIPEMAHAVVDDAVANGGLSLFEGNLTFERADLEELKKLLDYNLPCKQRQRYSVVTED